MYLPLLVVLIERRPILVRFFGGLTYPWIVFNTDASTIEVVQVSSNKFNSNKLNTFPIEVINILIFQEESSITFQIVTYLSHKHFSLHLTLNSSNYFLNSRNGSNIDRRLVEKAKKKKQVTVAKITEMYLNGIRSSFVYLIFGMFINFQCFVYFDLISLKYGLKYLFYLFQSLFLSKYL